MSTDVDLFPQPDKNLLGNQLWTRELYVSTPNIQGMRYCPIQDNIYSLMSVSLDFSLITDGHRRADLLSPAYWCTSDHYISSDILLHVTDIRQTSFTTHCEIHIFLEEKYLLELLWILLLVWDSECWIVVLPNLLFACLNLFICHVFARHSGMVFFKL